VSENLDDHRHEAFDDDEITPDVFLFWEALSACMQGLDVSMPDTDMDERALAAASLIADVLSGIPGAVRRLERIFKKVGLTPVSIRREMMQ